MDNISQTAFSNSFSWMKMKFMQISLKFVPKGLFVNMSSLVLGLATSHNLNQHWPRSMMPYGTTRPQWVKILVTGKSFFLFRIGQVQFADLWMTDATIMIIGDALRQVSEDFTDDNFVGIILCMCPANEKWQYNVTSSPTGWAHTQNDPWLGIRQSMAGCHPPRSRMKLILLAGFGAMDEPISSCMVVNF